jgi:hypothetical protein
MAAPVALSGSASAKAPAPTLAITKCAPKTATIGKSVTIHGTALAKATSVTIGTGKKAKTVSTFTHDSATKIKFVVPAVTAASDNVSVTVGSATSNTITCTFQKAPSKSKK